MRAIVMRLFHGRSPPFLWGQVAPAGAVVLVWAGRTTGIWPVPLGWAVALTLYAAGIWLIYLAFYSEWAKREQ